MSAYIIVDVEINNHEDYEEYKKLTPVSVELYGGSFIVRGGETEVLEGDWKPGRIVVLKFPGVEERNSGGVLMSIQLRKVFANG